ncbi:MAG: hypothetical protein ACOYOD_03795 [Saprospiraceae bacterium]
MNELSFFQTKNTPSTAGTNCGETGYLTVNISGMQKLVFCADKGKKNISIITNLEN